MVSLQVEEQSFGQILKRVRLFRGVSQRKLAALLKMDPSHINELENDKAGLDKNRKAVYVWSQVVAVIWSI